MSDHQWLESDREFGGIGAHRDNLRWDDDGALADEESESDASAD